MSNRAARFKRRLRERQALRDAETGISPEPVEPVVEKRKTPDRRVRSMSPDEVDDWLKRNGISGDRRKGERRHR